MSEQEIQMQDISNLRKEFIKNFREHDYYNAEYFGFQVIIRDDGYINATKLCAQALTENGNPKRYKHWKDSDDYQGLMEAISDSVGIPTESLEQTIMGKGIEGTYVHPDVIVHAATWASKRFAVKVSRIINNFAIQEAIQEKQREINQKDDIISKKDDKIDTLMKEMREMRLSLGDKIDDVHDDLTDQIEHVQAKFDTAVIHRVPPCINEDKNEYFMLIVLKPGEYKAVRGQIAQIEKMKKRYKKKRFIEFEEHPNAVNLLNRIRERQDEIGITVKNTNIQINDLTEHQFLNIVGSINDEKKQVQVVDEPISVSTYTSDGLEKLNMKQLRNICREKEMSGYSQYRKAPLIQFILENIGEN